MTTKYHVSKDGNVRECKAEKRPCTLTRFGNEQQTQHAGNTTDSSIETPSTPNDSGIQREIIGMKYYSYYGVKVEQEEIQHHIDQWRNLVGHDHADQMMAKKEERDGKGEYHVTTVSPRDTRSIKKQYGKKLENLPSPLPVSDLHVVGIGKASNEESEAWFLVCKDDNVNAWRQEVGLPPHDLHITLGFTTKDVHGVDKGNNSIVKEI